MRVTPYSNAFKEAAVLKTRQRGNRTIADMATELNVPYHSLKNWLRTLKMTSPHDSPSGEKRAQQWSAQERLDALLETQSLSPEELQAWCRQRGLFAHQLATWKAEFCTPAKPAADAGEMRKLKEQIAALQRNVHRKDKALSEAAALLVLQKKYQALWEDEDT